MRVAEEAEGIEARRTVEQKANSRQEASARQPKLVIRLQDCQGLSKYHRAAIDGYVDMLCDASKRNTNQPSENGGLTPTLLAAYSGHLEALRILVGRGGDPERTTTTGSNALHLAAARNHLNCVSFLVNFGVNMWSLDNDLHTAKDVAAMEQKNEVLEYLDQMMAKQSALNTKHVQKLKEKAKTSAEKRLKQMRKAQLKAIKQVERDERYLVKLSNNRRLLKAAHSISDIKLVERGCTAINYSPGDQIDVGRNIGFAKTSSKPGSLVINSRLSMQQQQQQQQLQHHHHQFHSKDLGCGGQELVATKRRLSSDESSSSSSSSSVSSSSGYLSSCSTRVFHYMSTQPKYSDLVALQEPMMNKDSSDQVKKLPANEKLSLKSNSTIATRLKGIGVSRKVQLKRLLLANAGSSNDLTATSRRGPMEVDTVKKKQLSRSQHDLNEPRNGSATASAEQSAGKLCNVQRPIKLKLNRNTEPYHTPSNVVTESPPDSPGNIKWPPAPAMSRAISEPDFGAALRAANEQNDENKQLPVESVTTIGAKGESRGPPANGQAQQDKPREPEERMQRHLLTKCLTQLKLHHEAITSQNYKPDDENNNQSDQRRNQSGPTKLISGNKSDELLQHQLSAGEFPIRPSIIKQQLAARSSQVTSSKQTAARKVTSKCSADSIGSAGSLVQRSSLLVGSSSSSKTTSEDLSSYTSTCCSSSACKQAGAVEQDHSKRPKKSQSEKKGNAELEEFLQLSGLADLGEVFAKERIDLEALMLLSEEDLKSLGILLGPRRKLLKAIESRTAAPIYVMVDTQL